MTMSTTEDLQPIPDEIELEPTMAAGVGEAADVVAPDSSDAGPAVALVEGSLASLRGATHTLRRSRLAAAALFLAVAFGVVLLWSLFGSDLGASAWVGWTTMALRCAIAAACAWVLLSRIALAPGQVRALEYILFGSCTVLLAISQYTVNLDLLRHGDVAGAIALVKNGVFGMVLLMVLYGLFIPNDARSAAKVILTMALVHAITLTMVMENPEVAEQVEQMRAVEHAGSNILFLLIGAALPIYAAMVLSGLRSELHEARRFGQYQLVRRLGEGGMGEVYLAEHQLLKRPCALKLIKEEAGADPIALARFEREVQSAAKLSHPNTIEIFDYGHTEDGTFYYVMEYLQGLSLSDLVRQAGPLPPGRVIYLFRQVCAGLAEAHALGLVHRDLKPGNVFVAVRGGESDVAKVLDFGLVKLTKDPGAAALTSDLTVSGTPLYMAPEQATADRSLDARADIYALGAMMYFALTGRPPFTGESAFAVMMAHGRDPVEPPSKLRPGLPQDLERVVLLCLAKKPEERYRDVKTLGQALAACTSVAEWDAERADRWWADHAPTAAVDAPPQPVAAESSEQT
jgi:serine/threonine-protein kinase